MKIIKLILLLTILFKTTKSQNRLDLRFSLGNGKPFAYKNLLEKLKTVIHQNLSTRHMEIEQKD